MTDVVYVYASPEQARYALVRGHVGRWFQGARTPALRSPSHGGYWIRRERVPDVMARLEEDGFLVRFVDGTAPVYMPAELQDDEPRRSA